MHWKIRKQMLNSEGRF